MSEPIAPPLPISFPIFESNQVLTNDHLNKLRQYLESEDRLTRNKLIGDGIVSGFTFEIAADQSAITIYAGAGVTTAGFIIHSEFGEMQEFITAKQYISEAAEPNLNPTPENTEFYELIPKPENGEDANTGGQDIKALLNKAGDKGILVFLEEVDVDIKSCFTTNCDDKGKQRHYVIKPMLVIVEDGAGDTLPAFQRPAILDLILERPIFPITNSPGILKKYEAICRDKTLNYIQNALNEVYTWYPPAFEYFTDEEIVKPKLDLISLRNDLLSKGQYFIQYFHDFITDLLTAYYEFIDYSLEIEELLQNVGNRSFKKHLILGSVQGFENAIFNRHHFRPVRLDRGDVRNISFAFFLLQRLARLINAFSLSQVDKIRITPSVLASAEQAQWSIPYYYEKVADNKLFERWNFTLTKKDKAFHVLSYHNTLYNSNANDPYILPLNYYHEDKRFLRIEGHIGHQKSKVIDELVTLRKTHRLAFDIVALRVTETGSLNDLKPDYDEKKEFKEYNFKDFIERHLGMTHKAGVEKGGTFIIVYQTSGDLLDGQVIADLALPYACLCKTQEKPIVLNAHDDSVKVKTEKEKDINVLKNDEFDQSAPIELDFVLEPDAEDITLKVEAETTKDIHISDRGIDPDEVEIDIKE